VLLNTPKVRESFLIIVSQFWSVTYYSNKKCGSYAFNALRSQIPHTNVTSPDPS
jgi:hypothetical protein